MKRLLINVAAFILGLLISVAAFAQTDVEYFWLKGGTTKPLWPNPEAICKAEYTGAKDQVYSRITMQSATLGNCIWKDVSIRQSTGQPWNTEYSGIAFQRETRNKCPAGQKRNLATDTCVPDEQEKKCKDSAGTKIYVTMFEGVFDDGQSHAADSNSAKYGFPKQNSTCKFSGQIPRDLTVESCESTPYQGKRRFTCTYSAKSSGDDADPSDPSSVGAVTPPGDDATGNAMSPKESPSGVCPAGSVQGGLSPSGIPMCFGNGVNPRGSEKPPETGTTKTETADNGDSIKTTTNVKTNADGSKTTETIKTVTKPDGTVETTKSYVTSEASNGNKGQQDAPASDICKANPSLTICKNSSVSGSCGAISCTGDAIQCATLQQAAAMRCAREDEDKALKASASYSLGQSVLSGADPLGAKLPSPANATNVSVPTSLTATGWLGGGQCFPDKSVSVMGKTVVIPFSSACDVLVALRYALMAAAALVSFKIVRGSILE